MGKEFRLTDFFIRIRLKKTDGYDAVQQNAADAKAPLI